MEKIRIKEVLLGNVLNFLLIGLLTVIISNYFNRKISDIERDFEVLQYDRMAAENTFEGVSEMMNTRLFRMKRLLWHYQDPQYESDRGPFRTAYYAALDEWNSNLSTNASLIELRFGKGMREQFENQVHYVFYAIHEQFIDAVRQSDGTEKAQFLLQLRPVESALKPLSDSIDEFNYAMLEAIESGNVGRNRPMQIQEQ